MATKKTKAGTASEKAPAGKAPRAPRTRSASGVNKKPSKAQKALRGAVEAPEKASKGVPQPPCLKREESGFASAVIRDTETARERGRAGGLASAAARRKRKEMREYLEVALKMEDAETGECNAMAAALALVEKAKQGDVRAWEAMLAAVGEKNAQVVDVRSGDGSMSPGGRDLTALPFDQLMELARAEWGGCGAAPAVEDAQ